MSLLTQENHGLDKTGFTLLEVMVSLSILAIVLVSIFKMQSQTILMGDTTKFYATAPMLAHQKLAEIDIFYDKNFLKNGNEGDFGDNFSGYRWSIFMEPAIPDMLGEFSEDFKRIDIKISLHDNEQTYHLRAYRFFRP